MLKKKVESEELKQLKIVLPHLLHHNDEHTLEMSKWIAKAKKIKADSAAAELEKTVAAMKKVSSTMRAALKKLK